MPEWTGDERVALVAERSDFLAVLTSTPHRKRALVEAVDASRSTVDRAISDLQAADLVTKTDEGWEATVFGRLLFERYRSFVRDTRTVLDSEGVLAPLPPSTDLPGTLLSDAETIPAADQPYRLYDRVLGAIGDANTVEMALPRLGDSRLYRLCHARLDAASFTGRLVTDEPTLTRLREEFPTLTADLTATDRFDVFVGSPPAYELVVTDEQTVFLLTAAAGGGLLVSDTPAVREWAAGVLSSAAVDASRPEPPTATNVAETSVTQPTRDSTDALGANGFRRIDRAFFTDRSPGDPVTAWQTGPDLTDVYYGITLDRRTDDGPVAATLVDRLADASAVAVVGPPGVGKSVVCRSGAVQWIREGHGPVVYRDGRTHDRLDTPASVAARVADLPGTPLVVVEDAAAEDTAVRELLAQLDGDASVLLEYREAEWVEPPHEPADATPAVRQQATDYRLPPVDEATCRRAIEAFEAATDRRVGIDAATLCDRIDGGDVGGMYLVSYNLLAHSGTPPWRHTSPAATGLAADVRAAHEAVADEQLAVATTLAGLVAAERPVSPTHATHAAAGRTDADHVESSDRTDADRAAAGSQTDTDRVAAAGVASDALDALEGRLLFEGDDGYRTQHPYWAVRFLETALDRDERGTITAFRRGVAALLAADDRWDSDALARALFSLAADHSSLVPLFGDATDEGFSLTDACSPETRLGCLRDVTLGWYEYGDLDRARRLAERLAATAETADVADATRERYLARSFLSRGELAEEQGKMDAAETAFERAETHAREADDDRTLVMVNNSLAWLAIQTGRFDDADDRLTAALDAGESLPPCRACGTTRYYRGMLARRRGQLASAEEWLRETRATDRELGNDGGEATTLNELGIVAERQGALDRAEEYYRACLELRRETENRTALAKNTYNLADLLAKRGDVGTASELLDRATQLATELGMERFEANLESGYGRVALERGNLEEAESRYRTARDRYAAHDEPASAANALAKLGDVARERGNVRTARQRYDEAADTLADTGTIRAAIDTLERCGETLADDGQREAARERIERARELATEAGFDDRIESLADDHAALTE